MQRAFRSWWGRMVAVLLSILACAVLALVIVLYTAWGRDLTRAAVTDAITQEIAGKLEVDGFDALSLTRVHARGIRIFAPDGKLAIGAARAIIDFDLGALMAGRYGWERAEIFNGKVYVTEDASGKINMEETFRARKPASSKGSTKGEAPKENVKAGDSKLDLKNMVTSDAMLVIAGGSLPRLRLVNLYGIMRVHVLADGKVELRFDDYKGVFARGLPTGTLVFRDVEGQVVPSHDRLLHFDGRGKTEGAPVEFELDIYTEPKKRVKIDAHFPELKPGAAPTLGVAAWSRFSDTFDVNVRFGT